MTISIISIIVTLAVVGLLMWLVNKYIPMDEPWKTLLNIVAIVVTILWLLRVFGIFTGLDTYRIR